MAAATRQLSTAAERREVLIDAAVEVFAEKGFHGTPTTAVAKAAGISQAYLFRLFPTKEELYVAAVERCWERLATAMRAGAESARAQGIDPLDGMGMAYLDLMRDRTTLRATLHAFAAGAGDEDVLREAVRRGYAELYELTKGLSGGADRDRMRGFFAQGMLCTVLAGMDASAIDADWARALLFDDDAYCAGPAPAAAPEAAFDARASAAPGDTPAS
jgi:AcrR family transcriptional regulator